MYTIFLRLSEFNVYTSTCDVWNQTDESKEMNTPMGNFIMKNLGALQSAFPVTGLVYETQNLKKAYFN